MRKLTLLTLVLLLSACSLFESKNKTPIDLGAVGPKTKDQLRELPKGLVADEDNSLHSGQVLRGDETPQ